MRPDGDITTGPVLSEAALDHIAHHEAGHVVVGTRLGLDVLGADILPDREGGRGHTHFAPPGRWFQPARGRLSEAERDLIQRVMTTFMAGFAAEVRAGGHDEEGSGYDRDLALREWVSYLADSAPERWRLMREFHDRADALLAEPPAWAAVERIAAELRRRESLTAADLKALVSPH